MNPGCKNNSWGRAGNNSSVYLVKGFANPVFAWRCYPYRAYIQNEHYTTSDNVCLNEEIPY